MTGARGRLVIPVEGDVALPWDYFVLEAARGGVRVPDWVLAAVRPAVGARLGIDPESVTGDEVEQALAHLPPDPEHFLGGLLLVAGLAVPDPKADDLVLGEASVLGSFRPAVGGPDLFRDACLVVLLDYSREGFLACMDAIEDPERWDARGAVAAMLYLLLLRAGAPQTDAPVEP